MYSARLFQVNLPMQVGFEHLAASRQVSDSILLQLNFAGSVGLGECAPRAYVTGETSHAVCQAMKNFPMPQLISMLKKPALEVLHALQTQGFEKTFHIEGANNLICLLETTVLDWLGKKLQLSVADMLPSQGEKQALIRISQVLDNHLSVEEFIETRGPFHFIKVKASQDHQKDLASVRVLRNHIADSIPVMVDANMHWSFEDAVEKIKNLRDVGVDFVEEPLAKRSWQQLGELRHRTGMPIMLDESVCSLQDARSAVGVCDAINVRVAKCGGLLNSQKMIAFAREHGLAFQLGVQVAECGPLIHAGRVLAVNNPDAMTVEAGQADRFFEQMVVRPRPSIDRHLNVFSKPSGLGFGLEITHDIKPFEIYSREGVLH